MKKAIILRLLRSGMATAIPALLALYADNPWLVAATPLLMTIAKSLRVQYPDNPRVKLIPF